MSEQTIETERSVTIKVQLQSGGQVYPDIPDDIEFQDVPFTAVVDVTAGEPEVKYGDNPYPGSPATCELQHGGLTLGYPGSDYGLDDMYMVLRQHYGKNPIPIWLTSADVVMKITDQLSDIVNEDGLEMLPD